METARVSDDAAQGTAIAAESCLGDLGTVEWLSKLVGFVFYCMPRHDDVTRPLTPLSLAPI